MGEDDGAPFAAAIGAELRSRAYDALLPGSDEALSALARHRSLVGDAVPGIPVAAQAEAVLDKGLLMEAGESVGLQAPASEVASRVDEALAIAARIGYPVMLKPLSSVEAGPRRTACSVVGPSDLLARAQDYVLPFIVQQRLDRTRVVSLGGVASGGRLRAIAVSRFLRTWPTVAGSASCSETIVPPAGLVDRCEALCARLGVEGIFELELLESADGSLSLIDLNPRVYGSLSLAIRAGANLPAIWCDLLRGDDPPYAVARPGVRYRWEEGELMNFRAALRRGSRGEALAIARPRRHTVGALRSVRDPLPLLVRGIELVYRRSRRSRS